MSEYEDPRTPQEVLEEFCGEWNQRNLNPQLYPLHMAPVGVAKALIEAQLDHDVEHAVSLPDDINDSTAFLNWVRSLESSEQDRKDHSKKLQHLQVVAKDNKGRVAALNAEVSMTPMGRTIRKPNIKVMTTLDDLSVRSTWIDPRNLVEYDRVKTGELEARTDNHGHERVELFRKSLQAMLRDSLKQAREKLVREEKKQKEYANLQVLIDELKSYGAPLKALSDKGKLDAGVGLGKSPTLGEIHFEGGRVSAKISTASSPAEREAFARLVNAAIDQQENES